MSASNVYLDIIQKVLDVLKKSHPVILITVLNAQFIAPITVLYAKKDFELIETDPALIDHMQIVQQITVLNVTLMIIYLATDATLDLQELMMVDTVKKL